MIDRSSSLISSITTIIFKVHEVNQKCCAEQSGLHLHIKIDWESHSEVLCVCEQFLFDTWPLFCNFSNLKTGFKEVKTMYTPHLRLIPKWHDVEVNVRAAVANPAASTAALKIRSPDNYHYHHHHECPHYLTRWRLYLKLLEAAGKAAVLAIQRTHWIM